MARGPASGLKRRWGGEAKNVAVLVALEGAIRMAAGKCSA